MTALPEAASPSDPKEVIDALSQRVKRLHRGILDKGVLRGLMPGRLRAMHRAGSDPETEARERRFSELSPSYATHVTDGRTSVADTRVVEIDSLTWWVPLPAPDDPVLVERALNQQNFPYRVITQTREAAIGGAMIDIGANTGRMSIPRVVLGDVTVAYCAEPDPLNYLCLVRNIRDNRLRGFVLPDQLAIGSQDGTLRLRRSRSAGGHRVVDAAGALPRDVIEVRSLRLDTWVDRIGIDLNRVRFVKVDVQGSEVDVLRGAPRVLAHKHIAWQIEIDLDLLAKRGLRGDDLYGLMEQHFTHFEDLNRHLTGPRVQPVTELRQALAHVSGGSGGRTDVLLFTLESTSGD